MNQEVNNLGSMVCFFLITNLSFDHILFDRPGLDDRLQKKLSHWNAHGGLNELAEWLRDLRYQHIGDLPPHFVAYDGIAGEFVEDTVGGRLIEKAHEANTLFSEISELWWFYFYVCAWLEHTFVETDRLMSIKPLHGTPYQSAYMDNRDRFVEMTQMLRREYPPSPYAGELAIPPQSLRIDLDVTAQELCSLWRETIYETVERILEAQSRR